MRIFELKGLMPLMLVGALAEVQFALLRLRTTTGRATLRPSQRQQRRSMRLLH